VVLAAGGVLYLTLKLGAPPWIAIVLALTFGGYGLVRKIAPIDSQRGLAIEGAWLLLPALGFLLWLWSRGEHHFGVLSPSVDWLIVATGPISAFPLLCFAYGARRIPLSLIGILQYIGPTLQLLTGIFLYNEPFTRSQLIGYGLIWTALAIYAADSLIRYARRA
jgi:chloramphenicol-sensitive protein RarD